MKPDQLRAQFPALKDLVWLNAAASSPTPVSVFEATDGFLRDALAHGDIYYPAWARLKEAVRNKLANFINASPTEVAFTPSTSVGFHIIGHMLKARGITEVLTPECEFPSTTLPLLHQGLTLRGVPVLADGTVPVAQLEQALTPNVGAIAVSAVQYASGYRADLNAVSQLCKAKGLTFIVNAAQGLGQAPLDVRAIGADFVAGTSHKWLMAGYGTGILYLAQRWLDEVPLPFGGWLSVEPHQQFQPWVNTQRVDDAHGFYARGTLFRKEASALEAGGGSWVGLYALDAALTLHQAVGVDVTLRHNVALQMRLREGLRRRGFKPTTPDEPDTLSGICVIPVQGNAADVVRSLLREANIATTARGGGLRISTHIFNDASDVEQLWAAVDRLGIKP
jgi:cysteine desulfurase/selenocysteine lyase